MMYDGTLMDGICLHIDRCTLFGMLVDAHVGILVDAHVGIWWIHFMDDIFWHIVDVHG
jgi:hypothetical protein